jgi:hypothetical protein
VTAPKTFTIRVRVEEPTTQYELVVGKTAHKQPDESHASGLAYFKDLAFMVNLQARRAAVFRMPIRDCSDLETAISKMTRRDRILHV